MIELGRKFGPEVGSHLLRRTWARHLLTNGADIRQIYVWMGHASLASTEVYLGVEASDLYRMIERSHPKGRGREPAP